MGGSGLLMENSINFFFFFETFPKGRVRYPFLQDPRVLSNNYRRVLRMMESLERNLDNLG